MRLSSENLIKKRKAYYTYNVATMYVKLFNVCKIHTNSRILDDFIKLCIVHLIEDIWKRDVVDNCNKKRHRQIFENNIAYIAFKHIWKHLSYSLDKTVLPHRLGKLSNQFCSQRHICKIQDYQQMCHYV